MKLKSLSSLSLPSIRSSRIRTRRQRRHPPASFLLGPSHLPSRSMPAKRGRLCLLLEGSQSGGHEKWQLITADRALLSSPAGAGSCRSTDPAQRQLQLRKHEHRTANPSGASSGASTTSAHDNQPCDSELEGQRASGGTQSRFNKALDTGNGFSLDLW